MEPDGVDFYFYFFDFWPFNELRNVFKAVNRLDSPLIDQNFQ